MRVLADDYDVIPRLEQLGMRRDRLIEVVQAAVGARRSSTKFHPLSAAGLQSWIEGTGHLRRIFTQHGWRICRRDNIESIYHPTLGLKVIFQNAERAGDPIFDPIAASKKGAGSARAVELGQYELWPELKAIETEEINATTWVLFVYAHGDDVRAELSCPIAINDAQFDGFHERIILIAKGEWSTPDPLLDDEPLIEYSVEISRKG